MRAPENRIAVRRGILIGAAVVFALLIAVRLVYFTVIRHDALVRDSRRMAMRKGVLAAPRGRILAENGTVLARTELTSTVVIPSLPAKPERLERFRAFLKSEFDFVLPEDPVLPVKIPQTLCSDAEALRARYRSLVRWPECRIVNGQKRIAAEGFEPLVGHCGTDADGIPAGESGFEAEYDDILRGTPGVFTVMVDRRGEWMPGTVRIENEPVPGKDVTVKVPELLK